MNPADSTDKQPRVYSAVTLMIKGEPASKANSRKIVSIGGKPRVIKSDKARGYLQMFELQCPTLPVLMEGDLRVDIHIHYASRRPDLDESVILDAMQGKIYVNDRQVKEKHIYWHLDPAEPRSEIRVSPVVAEGDRPGG